MKIDLGEIMVENASDNVKAAIVPAILTALLCTGFTRMIITAYALNVPFPDTMIMVLIFSAIFCFLFKSLKTRWSLIILLLTPVISSIMVARDYMYSRQALQALLFDVKEYSLHFLPYDIPMNYGGLDYMGGLFQLLTVIPIAISAFAFTKCRKVVRIPLIYLPFFVCSVANLGHMPHPVACEITVTGLILTLFLHSLRRRQKKDAAKIILRMSLPVLAIAIITGLFFPLERYNKYELANTFLQDIRVFLDDTGLGHHKSVRMVMDLAENGRISALVMSTVGGDAGEDTNLNMVGSLSNPHFVVGSIDYNVNYGYNPSPNEPNTVSAVYLRAACKSEYTGNAWRVVEARRPVFVDNTMINTPKCRYNIVVTTEVESSVSLTPYYCDFYTRFDPRDVGVNSRAAINPYESVTGRGTSAEYHACPFPVRTGRIYDMHYLSYYVYGDNLQVPESTRRAIIDSGLLPDWYISVMNGEVQMSDIDKVRYVTEFVRNLHPYDSMTGYPPPGSDFVVWFMTRSNTGFCVHYASTAVILLRMLNVPARYVDGYLVNDCYTGRTTNFYMTDAHAWFEFFDPEFGWIMGDPTPGNQSSARYYDVNAIMTLYPDYMSASSTPYEAIENSLSGQSEGGSGDGSSNGSGDDNGEGGGPQGETAGVPENIEGNSAAEMAAEQYAEDLYGNDEELTDAELLEIQRAQKSNLFKARIEMFLMGLLFFAVLLLTARLIYVVYWLLQFSKKDINARARAYYRYLESNRLLLGGRLPRAATAIAEKAAYSNKTLTSKEVRDMIRMCKRRPLGLSRYMPKYLKTPYLLIGFAVTHWCHEGKSGRI